GLLKERTCAEVWLNVCRVERVTEQGLAGWIIHEILDDFRVRLLGNSDQGGKLRQIELGRSLAACQTHRLFGCALDVCFYILRDGLSQPQICLLRTLL